MIKLKAKSSFYMRLGGVSQRFEIGDVVEVSPEIQKKIPDGYFEPLVEEPKKKRKGD